MTSWTHQKTLKCLYDKDRETYLKNIKNKISIFLQNIPILL